MDSDSSSKQNMKSSFEDSSDKVEENKKIKIDAQSLNPMVFYPGFPHIAEKIYNQFDKESLKSCREVSKSWLNRYSWSNQNS